MKILGENLFKEKVFPEPFSKTFLYRKRGFLLYEGWRIMTEWMEIFRRNFPDTVREERKVLEILKNPENRILEKRADSGALIGVCVVHKNTVYLLCVDKEYRGRGIASELLAEAEVIVKEAGYPEISVGAGDSYLAPGVPTSQPFYPEDGFAERGVENLYTGLTDDAAEFFRKRGYVHSWDGCDCFDMRFPLSEFPENRICASETADGILYRFASAEDIPEIKKCTDDAHENFTKYYTDETKYTGEFGERVLIALDGNEVCGTLIVCTETEGEGIGSVGCTTVRHSHRGRHIAVNMVKIGTGYLKDSGMTDAYLGYTYTGLDRLYGHSGYKICTYYMMAQKKL